jgi:hypothetical protein
VCNDQSIHETTVYRGVSRIIAEVPAHNAPIQEVPFTLFSEVSPLEDNRRTTWRVEFEEGAFETVPHSFSEASLSMWKQIAAATIVAQVSRKPITTHNPSDLIYVDPVAKYKIQKFPAWLTLGSVDYEVDIIKKSNGSTSFEVETVTECTEQIATLIEETVLNWAKKNPVGWSSKPDEEK